MNELIPMEHRNQRVMLTKTLAEQFGTDEKVLSNNFNRNTERFVHGKHYYKLEGEELKGFKTIHLNDEPSMLRVNCLYLWTERGVARHAKLLETDEAWKVYEILEDTYFSIKKLKVPKTFSQALRLAAELEEQKEMLLLESSEQKRIISEQDKKICFFRELQRLNEMMRASDIGALYGIVAFKFNKIMLQEGVIKRIDDRILGRNSYYVLTAKYAKTRYMQVITEKLDSGISVKTNVWLPEAMEFIDEIMEKHGYKLNREGC